MQQSRTNYNLVRLFFQRKRSTLTDFDNDNLAALIKAGKNGDNEAMTALINMHASSVHNLIYSIIHDASIVEDLAQETNMSFERPFDRGYLVLL